jgi:hypothetical protein
MANLEKYSAALARAKEAALALEANTEHEEELGEDLTQAETAIRLGIMSAMQRELGHGYIVSLCTTQGESSRVKIRKAAF